MDSSPTASSILDTLRTVEFRLGIKGYNVDEVDEYLDRAAQEAEALQENLRQLNDRLRQAGDRIVALEKEVRESVAEAAAPVAPAPVPAPAPATAVAPVPAPSTSTAVEQAPSDETLQRTLLLAQRFVDQLKRESEAEAAATVAQAEAKARATVAEAEQAAKTLEYESQRQVREEVARLEASRNELATDVESMARHLESERNRLREALSEILSWVDENVQPTNSLMGVRPKPASAAKPAAPAAIGATQQSAGNGSDIDEQPTLNLQSVPGTSQ
ncbi:MAG: DivIVA domain-containing protein [Acidimicrobiales bacterium]|jgi:cell division initiation protein